MSIPPEYVLAGFTLIGTLMGALIGQVQTIFAGIIDRKKRREDQKDRWEQRAFEAAEKLTQKALAVDYCASKIRSTKLEVKQLTGLLDEYEEIREFFDGDLEAMPRDVVEDLSVITESKEQLEEALSRLATERDEISALLPEVMELQGTVAVYLSEEAQGKLIALLVAVLDRIDNSLEEGQGSDELSVMTSAHAFNSVLKGDFSRG
ncbi:hypothetical protein AB0M72_03615 [Nocardiopsis dassonvillei]